MCVLTGVTDRSSHFQPFVLLGIELGCPILYCLALADRAEGGARAVVNPKGLTRRSRQPSHLAIPQVVLRLSSKQKDIVGVEGGSRGRDLHCFGIGFVVSMDLEEPYWRVRLCISLPGSPALERRKAESRPS